MQETRQRSGKLVVATFVGTVVAMFSAGPISAANASSPLRFGMDLETFCRLYSAPRSRHNRPVKNRPLLLLVGGLQMSDVFPKWTHWLARRLPLGGLLSGTGIGSGETYYQRPVQKGPPHA